MTSSVQYSILVVCSGNQCRSPVAQAVFASALKRARGTRWRVISAGVTAVEGERALVTRAQLPPVGLDLDAFRSRRLSAAMVEDADVVVTMTLEHAVQVLRLVPSALRKTVILRELARCAQRGDANVRAARGHGAMAELVRLTIRDRGPARPTDPSDDDIADPVRDLPKLLPGTIEAIDRAVRAVAEAVNPQPGLPRQRTGNPITPLSAAAR